MLAVYVLVSCVQVLTENDLIVEFMHMHWGLNGVNPVNRVRLSDDHLFDRLGCTAAWY